MRKNLGFTLIEILVAVTLTGMILLTGYSAFQSIMQAQANLGAAIDVQKNLFYTNEKLAALIRAGGTIDYEEYFNRRMLGYDQIMRADDIFTFTEYSYFGNGNAAVKPPIYYCGMVDTLPDPDESAWTNEESCMDTGNNVLMTTQSSPTATYHFPATAYHSSYGQYVALSYNYLDPVGYPMPIKLPPIFTSTLIKIASRDSSGIVSRGDQNIGDVGLPELYLIKKNLDNTYTRTYFRHVYVDENPDDALTCNPATNSLLGCLGKIQMTRLESCDTFLPNGSLGNDGIIDAWIPACPFNATNLDCTSTYIENTCPDDVANIYTSAHEAEINPGSHAPNLSWVDITTPDMNVVRATFLPNPLKIPTLMSGAGDTAQSPRVSVYLEVALSTKLRNRSFVRPEMNYPRILITTYDLSQ